MHRPVSAGFSPSHLLATACLLALVLLSGAPLAAKAEPAAQVPKASAPFLVAGGPGNQASPSLAGNVLVYSSCTDASGICKVQVLDRASGQQYTAATTWFDGQPSTDGTRVLWTDARNKTSTHQDDPLNNLDIYAVNISGVSGNAVYPVAARPRRQEDAAVSGNIAVWSDWRDATNPQDAGDIYMYDFNTGKERLIANSPHAERYPVTNGKVVVWEEEPLSTTPSGDDDANIYGYDIATGKIFAVSTASGPQVQPAVWGNTVVYEGMGLNDYDIYTYDISTKKTLAVTKAPGQQTAPSIYGSIVVWQDGRADPYGHGGPLLASDIYGYDLAAKREFQVAVGSAIHSTPKISGNAVVWVDSPKSYIGGQEEIMGATLNGVPPAPNAPKEEPQSRNFSETGKTVSGRFLDYWNKNGGLAQQGFPISEVMTEVSDLDGKSYTVQYFERAVFEQHPENKPPYDVLLSQLGTFHARQKNPAPAGGITPGTITGKVDFPLPFGFQAFRVYALPVNGGNGGRYFSVNTWENETAYTLAGVAPGTYYIVAYLSDAEQVGNTPSAAAYTRSVPCIKASPQAKCADHTLVPVTVKAGETVRGIDAIDPGTGLPDVDLSTPPGLYPTEPDPEGRCTIFAQTSRTVCGKFLQYWLLHGDIAQQGLPISDETVEKSDLDGKPYTVQYFQRAVFEYHPEQKPPFNVLLSQLGTFRYKEKYGGR